MFHVKHPGSPQSAVTAKSVSYLHSRLIASFDSGWTRSPAVQLCTTVAHILSCHIAMLHRV